MAEIVILTKEDIQKADSYMPLRLKGALAKGLAMLCVNNISYGKSKKDGEKAPIHIPGRYMEDGIMRSRYSLSVFLKYYLHLNYELDKDVDDGKKHIGIADLLISDREYDKFMQGHIMNQPKRMKGLSPAEQDKVYDMLLDFKDFEKRLGAEINNLIQSKNDQLNRLVKLIISLSDLSELGEVTEALKGALDAAKGEGDEAKNG